MPGDAGQACASACRDTGGWADPVIGQRVPTWYIDTIEPWRDKLRKAPGRVGALVVARDVKTNPAPCDQGIAECDQVRTEGCAGKAGGAAQGLEKVGGCHPDLLQRI